MGQGMSRYVVIVAAAMIALLSSAAFSASLNSPRGPWEVGPINAVSSSGVGFCSMKNVYDDGKGLIFARDAEGSNSIAVSFTKKTLTSGAQYTVELDADGLKRSMVALAATPTVLIVQMGLDRDFYTILRKKTYLQISVKDVPYGFSLSGTAEALDTLTKCAQERAAGKSFPTAKVALTPVQGPVQAVAPVASPMLAGIAVGTPATMGDFNVAKQSADSTLKDEIARLQLENRRLMAENQAATQRLISADKTEAVTDAQLQAEMESQEHSMKQSATKSATAQGDADMGILVAVEPAAGDAVAPAPEAAPTVAAFAHDLLTKAGLAPVVQGLGYVWRSENIYGAAEERPLARGASIVDTAAAYIAEAKTRCSGDFAHKEAAPAKAGSLTTLEGEVVCLDGKNDAAAALLFVGDKNKVAIISHEGMADQIEDALTQRDAVKSAISKK